MNADAYNLIIETISKPLEAKGFKVVDLEDGSYFENGAVAVRVQYSNDRELFTLEHTTMSDGEVSNDWKVLSSWLFAKDAPIRDAKSIANDFEDSLFEFLGVKPATAKVSAAAKVPTKGSVGDIPTPSTLAGRFLTVFPQFKEKYEAYVAENGSFLYVHFFEEIAAPHMAELLDADDKKHLVKFFDMLNHAYCNGDKEVRSVVSFAVLYGALKGNEARIQTALSYMEELPHLKNAMVHALRTKVKQ